MRPKLFTPRNLILALLAILLAIAWFVWQQSGGKIAFIDQIPSTAGKIAFVRGNDVYMTDASSGANAVALTNDGKAIDGEPAWSENGETLALTSDRNGVVRQLYIMNAMPGATVAVRTNSSSTKESPVFGPEGDIFFLDGGKIAKLTPKTADIDAIFPTAEQKRKALASLFEAGGVTRFAVSPDGTRFFVAVKREQDEALILYATDGTVAVFGFAEKILFRYLPDGNLIAVFCGGSPLPKPGVLMNADTAQIPGFTAPDLPPFQQSPGNSIVRIDPQFAIQPLTPIPFAPNGLTVSSDGTHAVITSADKKYAGVFLVPLDGGTKGGPIVTLPASEPVFSPDGSKVAFVSNNDILVAKSEPHTKEEPLNLTKGQGTNTSPIWSPAKPKK